MSRRSQKTKRQKDQEAIRHKIIGDLGSKQRPLVTLHGGPDDNHEYPLVLTALVSTHGIPLIFYDQIGSGPSTHLLVKKDDGTIWTGKLFCDELNNMDRHLARYGTSQPKGLNKLIISDFPVLMELFVQSENRLRNGLPKNVQDTLMRHEGCGTTIFYTLHVCRLETWPHGLTATFRSLEKDPTVYKTMNGPNEFHVIATWSVIDELHNQPQDETAQPFLKTFPSTSGYTPQREETTRHLDIVGTFLA
ncbi:proline iminopeptidase [Hysterangium stoloniferum]|nr:proline iminopeptidase [Hysterangium stoloniferum]